MAGRVGERIDVVENIDVDLLEYAGQDQVERVTAWPVLPLHGARIVVSDYQDIPVQVRALLASSLPDIDFWVPDVGWEGSFHKHGFLHHCFPAPPNEATGEAMSLELFGCAQRMWEHNSPQYLKLLHEWSQRRDEDEARPSRVILPTPIVIEVATYSNVCLPGVQVPMYG